MTYWERFENLCTGIGKKANPVGSEIGVSSSTITKWKNGAIPNGEILLRVADYFGCSVDYLLGRTDTPDSGNSEILNNLTAEQMQDVIEYVQFLKWRGKASRKEGEIS